MRCPSLGIGTYLFIADVEDGIYHMVLDSVHLQQQWQKGESNFIYEQSKAKHNHRRFDAAHLYFLQKAETDLRLPKATLSKGNKYFSFQPAKERKDVPSGAKLAFPSNRIQ